MRSPPRSPRVAGRPLSVSVPLSRMGAGMDGGQRRGREARPEAAQAPDKGSPRAIALPAMGRGAGDAGTGRRQRLPGPQRSESGLPRATRAGQPPLRGSGLQGPPFGDGGTRGFCSTLHATSRLASARGSGPTNAMHTPLRCSECKFRAPIPAFPPLGPMHRPAWPGGPCLGPLYPGAGVAARGAQLSSAPSGRSYFFSVPAVPPPRCSRLTPPRCEKGKREPRPAGTEATQRVSECPPGVGRMTRSGSQPYVQQPIPLTPPPWRRLGVSMQTPTHPPPARVGHRVENKGRLARHPGPGGARARAATH